MYSSSRYWQRSISVSLIALLAAISALGSLPLGRPAFWALRLFAASCLSVIVFVMVQWIMWIVSAFGNGG
jgi:hypothetical protein